MQKILFGALVAALLCVSAAASADPVPFKLGGQVDLSVPSGAAVGLEARLPHVPWFKLGLSGTYLLSPGIRGNLLIDPIKFPIAPVANVDVGHQFPATVPVSGHPTVDFSYLDLQGGLGLGNRDGFRFLLLGGMSYLFSGNVGNFQSLFANSSASNLTVGNPSFRGWAPNVKLGVEFLF
jgi:hypothetical protein